MSIGSTGSAPLSGPQLVALLAALGFQAVGIFTSATRPAPGNAGALALITDGSVPVLYEDDGTSWQVVQPPKVKSSRDRAARSFESLFYR